MSQNLRWHNATAGCTSPGPDKKKRNFTDFLVKSFSRGSLPLLKPKNLESFFVMVSSLLVVTLLIVFSVDITHVVL